MLQLFPACRRDPSEVAGTLAHDGYRDIRFDPARSLWKQGGGNFQVQFIHPGLYYGHAVAINTVDRDGVRKVPFSPKMFTYGRNKFAEKIPVVTGEAKYDDYTVLIVINFNRSDLDKPEGG